MDFEQLSIWVRNYKCFGADRAGFDELLPFNMIIGRNNSGKSALLDLIQYCCDQGLDGFGNDGHLGETPQVIMRAPLIQADLDAVFHQGHQSHNIPGPDDRTYGRQWVGNWIEWSWHHGEEPSLVAVEPIGHNYAFQRELVKGEEVARHKSNPLRTQRFRRLVADRDVVTEESKGIQFFANGQGATNLIQSFINNVELSRDVVEIELLENLNEIFASDANFRGIEVQRIDGQKWEVYLREDSKGRIPLSKSGSGLKTVILVLCHTILVPKLDGKAVRDYVFGFEELENNLHPSLARRLFTYLYRLAVDQKGLVLVTTHSPVVIDLLSTKKDAQIIHVLHDGKEATARRVVTYFERKGILDDLDVRASDLLQSNGIIWVEGPSDRIYINRWIELWSDGRLREGTHYQCVFYGGRLLAHLSGNPDAEELAKLVNIFLTNRNAAILMDSDKKSALAEIGKTKQRVQTEIRDAGGIAWVTAGREIENYITPTAVRYVLGLPDTPRQVQSHASFVTYLNRLLSGAGDRFARSKPLFAEKISPYLEKSDLEERLDLDEQVTALCALIRTWNGV